MDKEKKLTARRPVVLKKLNADNLQLIERGLLGDIPDRFKPYQGPVRADSNDLVVAKPSGFLSSCLPVIPDSPCSEKFPDEEPLSVSPLKKSFSFRGFSRISFLGKKEKPKWKTIVEDERHIDEAPIDEDTRRKENEKSRRRWFFKNKEEERRVGRRPIYSRSKSFEFLPKALEEDPAESVREHRKLAKNASFVFGSTDSLADVWPSNGPDSPSDVYYDTEDCIFLKSVKEISPESSKYNSSVSTVSSNPSGIANSILNRESFQNLLDEFNRTVEIFSENYSSDCEPYTKPNSGDVKFRDRKKSSSFSTLPSPKVVQNKVSEVSEDFKLELSRMLSKKRATAVPDLKSPRRGSVTDWFVLEDPAATGKTSAASEANKYKRAQEKPQNRVRRMSSTKYWITPEECAVYSREQRPPLVIPRITQYRTPKRQQTHHTQHYVEEPPEPVLKPPIRNYDWSPGSDRGRDHDRSFSKNDSPPFSRINKRLGGSTENLLGRRPNHLQLAASSSGDSLDVEIRERKPGYARNSKSRSMVAPKQVARSPVPAPRLVLPSHHEMTVLLEGPVKRTKFCESGKKCRKNWIDCYMVLTPTDLIFYKKPPSVPPSPGSMNPELNLSLKNAHVVKCIPNHTKSFTRSLLLTVGYDQYLIQDETEERAMRWMKGIVSVSYKLGPPKVDDFPQQYQSSNTDIESLGRTPPVARHNNRSNTKAGGSSNEDLSDSTEGSIPKAKRTLRSFFPKRPTKDFLIKKGIYKEEPVFGRKLEEVCPATSPRVPEFVVACIKVIERSEENMTTDGLYRASGNLSQVQKIRLEVDQNKLSVLTDENTDIHVLTGSLKLFFRELKEPLIPCAVFDRVLAACSIKPREAKIKEFRDIVNSLPQCNRDTLKFLLEHLLRVTQYSERNRMHTANLAIVFGPTLLWAPAEQAHNIAIDCIQQNHVVEILLNEFKDIFVENGKAKKKS